LHARAAPAPTQVLVPAKTPVARTAAYAAFIAGIAVVAGGLGAYIYVTKLRPESPPVAEPKSVPRPTPEAAAKAAAEQEQKEKEARAEAERLAKAERERLEAQRRAEEDARGPRPEHQTKIKQAQEAARRAEAAEKTTAIRGRAAAKEAQKKTPEPQIAAVEPAPPPQPPAPQCPQQGEVAIYNCFRELARSGDALAALKVGELFEAGRGVARSNNTAYYWYAVSEQRGAPGAKAKKDAVAARLQPMEIDQMDKLVRNEARSGK
jgi:hypothetical protein